MRKYIKIELICVILSCMLMGCGSSVSKKDITELLHQANALQQGYEAVVLEKASDTLKDEYVQASERLAELSRMMDNGEIKKTDYDSVMTELTNIETKINEIGFAMSVY